MTPTILTQASWVSLQSTYVKTMNLLENCSDMKELKQIHAGMLKTRLIEDTILSTKLVTFTTSANFGDLAYAQMIFDGINEPNTFIWNTMVRGYSCSNNPEKSLLLYYQMLCNSVPHNSYTFPFLLKACSNLSAFEETQQVHAQIIKLGFGLEIYALNSLLHVYALCGRTEHAHLLFDQIPQPDVVSWNSMIDGCMKSGDIEMGFYFFKNMPVKNLVSWTCMISGLVNTGRHKEALSLFQEMQNTGLKPDNVSLSSAISACAHLGELDQGRVLHSYICENEIKIDCIMGCVLINMYAKCGEMEEALRVFREMENRDLSVWTALIDSFAIHGEGREALECFTLMQKADIMPNLITFTAILRACSYSGLVKEGKSLFKRMKSFYNFLSIEHYGCMVDLLGRAGLLEEAKLLIKTMPLNPNAVIWGALLKACLVHNNLDLGKQIGKILVELDSQNSGRFIQMARILSADGEWEEAAKMRQKMKNLRISKLPGKSLISLNQTVHEFLSGDQSHPQMNEIYKLWDKIVERLRKEGYEPQTGDLLLDLENEEKEIAVQEHSEKLAIVFGLINTEPGTTIRVFKNLRVCQDCHNVAKLISKIYRRDIVMRDRIRFHVFKEGKCSCGGYW